LRQDRSGLDGEGEERAGLHRLEPADVVLAERRGAVAALRGEIEHLPADHAAEPGCSGETHDQLGTDRPILMRRRVGHELEGERLKRVAGEDRGRLVEAAVHRRLAAAQVVVVHGGEVVVNEGVAVQELKRGAGLQHAGLLMTKHPRRLDQEKRPQPLAARQHGMAHRRDEARRTGDLARPGVLG
jgi:hypothetical protein